MTPTLFPSVFTIEIGGTPTVTFEAKSLREAIEICNAPWLREDFTQHIPMAHRCGMAKLR